jgi:hypothetical protein
MHRVAKLSFPGPLNLVGGSNLPLGGAVEEGRQEGLLVSQRAILVAASAFARRIERRGT